MECIQPTSPSPSKVATQPSKKLAEAAQVMVGNPAALELRRMQMVAEVGAENNSTTVIMIPAEFAHIAGSLSTFLEGKGS